VQPDLRVLPWQQENHLLSGVIWNITWSANCNVTFFQFHHIVGQRKSPDKRLTAKWRNATSDGTYNLLYLNSNLTRWSQHKNLQSTSVNPRQSTKKWFYHPPTFPGTLLLLFWHAPLGVHSTVSRHQPPQRTFLGQVDCFIQCGVVGSQIMLDGVQSRDTRTPWWSLPATWWGSH